MAHNYYADIALPKLVRMSIISFFPLFVVVIICAQEDLFVQPQM